MLDRWKEWFWKAQRGDSISIKRMYCLKEKRVTEHEYKRIEMEGLEWYDEYTCLICGTTQGYGKKEV